MLKTGNWNGNASELFLFLFEFQLLKWRHRLTQAQRDEIVFAIELKWEIVKLQFSENGVCAVVVIQSINKVFEFHVI